MIDHKNRSDPSIGPLDIGKSYVDSVLNEGSVNIAKLISDSSLVGSPVPILDQPLFQPGTGGVQTRPGEAGFAYADTPEATIFIQKREWVEDDWTYVSNSVERSGKEEELITRIQLANIITRKLDWLNSHEIFSKVSKLTSGLTSQFAAQIKGLNDPTQLTLSGAQVTRYYTEPFALTSTVQGFEEIVKESSVSIALQVQVTTNDSGANGRLVIRDEAGVRLTSLHGPHTTDTTIGEVSPGTVVVYTTGPGDENKPDNVVPGQYSGGLQFDANLTTDGSGDEAKLKPEFANRLSSAKDWKIDLTKITISQIFPDKNLDTLAQGFQGTTRADLKLYVLNKLKSIKVGYIARVTGNNKTSQLATAVPDFKNLSFGLPPELKPKSSVAIDKEFRNLFNGVIELANVDSLSISISNSGAPGTAQITLQNPHNVLHISEDDIDIALSENPFLKGSPLENTSASPDLTGPGGGKFRYYRGRYYTDRGFRLVTRQDLSAFGNAIVDVGEQALSNLKDLLIQFQADLSIFGSSGVYPSNRDSGGITVNALTYTDEDRGIETYLAVQGDPGEVVFGFGSLSSETIKKISEISNAIIDVEREIQELHAGDLKTSSEIESPEFRYRRNQLKRYFQNRTLFQVFDRIFIWLTSPSRTVRTLPNSTIVSEDFTTGQLRAKRVQTIIGFIEQLDGALQTLTANTATPVGSSFTNEVLATINGQLFTKGQSDEWDKKSSEISSQTDDSFIKGLIKVVNQKIQELKTFIDVEDSETTAEGLPSLINDTFVQGIDPKNLFSKTPTKFAGVVDQQYQAFQGVITRVSRSYSDGKYTVVLECKDNLEFLSRSRFITVPGLNQYANQARPFLDDPIFRQKDSKFTDKIVTATGLSKDKIFGRWKTGIMTLTANIEPTKESKEAKTDAGQAKQPATDVSNTVKTEIVNTAFGRPPQAENEPFAGADPAQIISILVTGYPFDVAKYVENAIFKGSIDVNPTLFSQGGKANSGETLKVGPFEQVRQEIWPQARKYGDFEPYLEQTIPLTEADKAQANTSTQINIVTPIILFLKIYSRIRQGILSKTNDAVVSESKKEGSAFKEVDETNFGTVIQSSDTFPTSVVGPASGASAPPLNIALASSLIGKIDPVARYLLEAALRGVMVSQLNAMLTGTFNNADFEGSLGTAAVNTFKTFTNREKLALTDPLEISNFNQIRTAAVGRVSRGVTFQVLLEGKEIDIAALPKPPQAGGVDLDAAKKARDALLHPQNPLQATKISIIKRQKPNFFVVSDQYLRNDDLNDYVRQIGNPGGGFQDNQYSTVLERCARAAKTIDYELYADTQGHIRFKPPTYNKALLKHLMDIRSMDSTYVRGVYDILKDFGATDIFKAPIYTGYKIKIADIKRSAITTAQNYLAIAGATQATAADGLIDSLLSIFDGSTKFLLDSVVEEIGNERLSKIQAFFKLPSETTNLDLDPETHLKFDEFSDLAKETGAITAEVDELIKTELESLQNDTAPKGAVLQPTDSKVIQAFDIAKDQDLKDLILIVGDLKDDREDFEKVSALVDLIEGCVHLALVCTKTIVEINSVVAGIEPKLDAVIKSLTDARFVHNISGSIILNENWQENRPDFTRLNASTAFAFSGINQDSVEGQRLHWVGSVDYDLWRIYGYIPQEINIPFLQTGESAVRYIHMHMARQYSRILSGAITVRGDSKYQLGDCVFVEDENLYYYIIGIQHNFAYGQQFTTTLNLEYGRRPGYFIPYPFDVLGAQFTRGANIIYGVDESNVIPIKEAFDEQQKIIEGNPNHNN